MSASAPSSQPPQMKKEHPIDARLGRINNNILPTAPYLLGAEGSLNSQHVQRVYHHTLNNWRKGTNFEPHEEKLQYMTFKDRSADGNIRGLHARGGWDDGNGAIAPLEASSSRSSTDFSATAGPRKKITLAEYKDKARNKALGKPLTSKTEGIEATKKPVDETTITTNAVKPVAPETQTTVTSQKRSADTMNGQEDTKSTIEPSGSIPPAKKLRTNPTGKFTVPKEPPTHTPKEPATATSEGQSKPVSQVSSKETPPVVKATKTKPLPSQKPSTESGKSSDIAKPATKPSNNAPPTIKLQKPILPPMLSPLASDIEEELAKLDPLVRKRSHSAISGGPSSVSPNAKQPKTHAASTPSSGEKDKLKKAMISISSTPTNGPQESKQITSAPRQGIQEAPKPAALEGAKKLRLRVTLKIKKKVHRKTLHQYLRMKPTPGKYPWGTLKPGEKRGRAQDDKIAQEPPAKRQKAAELEPKSTPMTRVPSGGYAPIPEVSTGWFDTPKKEKSPQASPLHPSKPDSKNKTPEDLRSESQRLMALAKQLKYESDVYFKNPEGKTDEERVKAVVIAMESVLCFMLAFTVNDAQNGSVNRNGWLSILAFLNTAQTEFRSFDPLFGLARQLGGITHDIVIQSDLNALDSNPLADQFGKAKSADPNKTEDQNRASEYHRRFSDFARLTEQSQKAWWHGLSSLSPAKLADSFPNTWAKRDKTKAPRGKDAPHTVCACQYKRSYWLPLSQLSSALEAINFGLDFLQEYCQIKGIEWKPKLVL